MSIITSIRKHSWLLIVFVGLALFAFIFGGKYGKGGDDANVLGKVNRDEISYTDYSEAVSNINAQYGGKYPMSMVQSTAWNDVLESILFKQQLDKLGIPFSDQSKQISDAIGNILLQQGIQSFHKGGVFNLQSFETAAANAKDDQAQFFRMVKSVARKMVLQQNYVGLVQQGVLATDKEIEFEYQSATATADADYVYVPYATYAGAKDIKISDAQIEEYLKAHEKQFKKEATRDVQYVLFEGNASTKDKAAFSSELSKYINDFEEVNNVTKQSEKITGFKNTTDNKGFIANYSEGQYNDQLIFETEGLDAGLTEFAKSAPLGSVYGPYTQGKVMAISKVVDRKTVPDSIKLSMILVAYNGGQQSLPNATLSKDKAKAKADQLVASLSGNSAGFAEAAKNNSDDPASRLKGGEIGWVNYNGFAQQLPMAKDFIATGAAGSIKLIEIPQGYAIFKIDETRGTKTGFALASVIKNMTASKQTSDSINNLARKTAESFNGKEASAIAGLAKSLKVNLASQEGFEQFSSTGKEFVALNASGNSEGAEKIISWAFDGTNEPKTAEILTLGNGNMIVAYLVNKYDAGLPSAKVARKMVEPILKNKEIAKKVIAQIGNNKDLNKIASMTGQTVKSATNISFANPVVTGVGREGVVGGLVFGTKVGQVSTPAEGNLGVFVVKPTRITPAPANFDKRAYRKNVEMASRQMIPQSLVEALKALAKIEDLRGENPYFKRR